MAGTIADMIKRDKIQKKEPEWTQAVKTRKTEDYYNKLSKVSGLLLVKNLQIDCFLFIFYFHLRLKSPFTLAARSPNYC